VIQTGTVHTKPQEFRNLNLLPFLLLNFPKSKRSQTTLMSDSELSTENLEILVLYYSHLQVSHWQELGPAKAAS
jgi:hypothetical protein